jgi:hypothetical protein
VVQALAKLKQSFGADPEGLTYKVTLVAAPAVIVGRRSESNPAENMPTRSGARRVFLDGPLAGSTW